MLASEGENAELQFIEAAEGGRHEQAGVVANRHHLGRPMLLVMVASRIAAVGHPSALKTR
jgi:hypothetical protein